MTLSDDVDTPGQSALFFANYRIEEFVHLRALRLIAVEFDSLEPIFLASHRLRELRSLSFKESTFIHDDAVLGLSDAFTRTFITFGIRKISLSFSAALKHILGVDMLETAALQHLKHLEIDCESSMLLRRFCELAPHVKSIVSSYPLEFELEEVPLHTTLNRLHVKWSGEYLPIDRMIENIV